VAADTTTETRTTCPYCGVGCGVIATREPNGAISVRGDPDHPANFGRLCSKGSALAETIDLEGRLLHPQINGRRASWDDAINLVAQQFTETIAEHGPDSVAFYLSGQLLTEDYYAANKLMKGFIGSANIDTNSRLCMASSVAGHRRAFGSDTVPGNYEDLELADLIVLVGSNLAWCHPVLFQRIMAAKEKRPHLKLVVIDPRRTVTADSSDLFLPIKPDGDVALFAGLLGHLNASGKINRAFVNHHTSGLEAALAEVPPLTNVSAATGLKEAELVAFYALFAATEKTVTVYSQGVNQSAVGTDKVNTIINCHLATGRIGKRGMGPFSVTGQPNAMGGREVGGMANMLAAHMEIENHAHRDLVQGFWQSPAIVKKQGLKAVDVFEAVANGRIKALWIMGTNPVVSMPDANAVEAAMKDCPFVVVSDVLETTDTVRHAHVKLPAAGWGEKDGTVTNSERRISRQRPFLPMPGEAMADWKIVAEVGKRMGYAPAFDWQSPAEVFAEFADLSGQQNGGTRDFDISEFADMTCDSYDLMAPFQWPRPRNVEADASRFFGDGEFFTPDRKARFISVKTRSLPRAEGLVLNTGRVRDHWHTMTRTGKSVRLSQHIAEPFCEINAEDAMRLGLRTADLVKIENRRGSVIVRASVTAAQKPGEVFAPMHWNDNFAANARIGKLVAAQTDPVSGQPALKMGRVNISRFTAELYGFAVTREKPELDFPYWASAKVRGGWRTEFAVNNPDAEREQIARKAVTSSSQIEWVTYEDSRRGDWRYAGVSNGELVGIVYMSSKPVAAARSWAAGLLEEEQADIPALLAGRPGAGKIDKGSTVCSCFSVGFNEIANAVLDGSCLSVQAVGERLKAGTNCGSCRSEIKRIIASHIRVAAE
jgi:assimilatory nitrate reductase catalytic subunit